MDRRRQCYDDTFTQRGATFVEAAITMPLLLFVSFVSLFFFMVGARNASLQMLANDIAKDISLSLQNGANTATSLTTAMQQCSIAGRTQTLRFRQLGAYRQQQETCWRNAAASQFLLKKEHVEIALTALPVTQWFDDAQNGNDNGEGELGPGDIFRVQLSYPTVQLLGQKLPFFTVDGGGRLYASAVGVMEKPDLQPQNAQPRNAP